VRSASRLAVTTSFTQDSVKITAVGFAEEALASARSVVPNAIVRSALRLGK
jgi:hypothetical protein